MEAGSPGQGAAAGSGEDAYTGRAAPVDGLQGSRCPVRPTHPSHGTPKQRECT